MTMIQLWANDTVIDIMRHAQLFSKAAAHWEFAVLNFATHLVV